MSAKKNGRPLKAEGKRTRFIKARLTETEYELLKKDWISLGLKESDFLRLKLFKPSSLSARINAMDLLRQLDGIGAEIGRSGNNINQLARHANFLNKRGMLGADVVGVFNSLFSDYIRLFREMEKTSRELIRLLKS